MLFGLILVVFLAILFFYVIGTYLLAKPEDPVGSIKNVIDHTVSAYKGEK